MADYVAELAAFAEARYDEDETVARAAADLPCCEPLGWRAADRWSHRPRGLFTRDDTGGRAITLLTPDYPDSIDSGVDLIRAEDGGIPLTVADHIVTWDPARVLAEIAAKRKRLALYLEAREALTAALTATPAKALDETPATAHSYSRERITINTLTGRFTAYETCVRLDVAAYSAHADYDPAWRIDG